MRYELYIDVFFLEQIWLHFLVMQITGISGEKYRTRAGRAALWSLGDCMGILSLSAGNKILWCLVLLLQLASLIHWYQRKVWFLLTIAAALECSCEMAGQYLTLPFGILSLLAAGPVWLLKRMLEQIRSINAHSLQVTLCQGQETITVTGFWDTGNHLREPITGKPVSILEEKVYQQFKQKPEGMFLIPYHAVGTANGWLTAIQLDAMRIQNGTQTIIQRKPFIAISEETVCTGGEYQMILHPGHGSEQEE